MNYETYAKIGLFYKNKERDLVVKFYNRTNDRVEIKVSPQRKEFPLDILNPEDVLEVIDLDALQKVYNHNEFGEFLTLGEIQKISNKPFEFPVGSRYFRREKVKE